MFWNPEQLELALMEAEAKPKFRVPPPSEVMPEWPMAAPITTESLMGQSATVLVPAQAARYVVVDEHGEYETSAWKLSVAKKKAAALSRKFGAKFFHIIDTGPKSSW
jgi:hypothetical protein